MTTQTDLPPTLAGQLDIQQTGPDTYESVVNPLRLGNAAPVAFGGATLGVAVHAALRTVPPSLRLYSCLGHYLGPASATDHLHCRVERTRDSKAFSTRRVQVIQQLAGGKVRNCLDVFIDFHAEESALFTYSAAPEQKFPAPDECPDWETRVSKFVERGEVHAKAVPIFRDIFRPLTTYFDQRGVPDGLGTQNLIGLARGARTTQDSLPFTERWSAEWYRLKELPENQGAQVAALAFIMDTSLSFLPLTHSNKFWDAAGLCSSLDFALRVFVPDVDLHGWHVKQSMSKAAGAGRTYSENLLWDQQGRLVASMTQQSILRSPPAEKEKPKPAAKM
ncbi:hypothetical protein SEUCBS139899_010565 [Sporothrix eucalyptigena]|uniref:Acyl-CoA thioesterase II n=1 Tax=Sporothrix eucalyptigena TaxID=1812306 RepID=A0ABP0B8Y0_9PEZI